MPTHAEQARAAKAGRLFAAHPDVTAAGAAAFAAARAAALAAGKSADEAECAGKEARLAARAAKCGELLRTGARPVRR